MHVKYPPHPIQFLTRFCLGGKTKKKTINIFLYSLTNASKKYSLINWLSQYMYISLITVGWRCKIFVKKFNGDGSRVFTP